MRGAEMVETSACVAYSSAPESRLNKLEPIHTQLHPGQIPTDFEISQGSISAFKRAFNFFKYFTLIQLIVWSEITGLREAPDFGTSC
ncbi:unnamed protein product [Allacma fusca]|uniref:Uncharacterized protein n=1 Tax=Allacma fusca TaxID=39272 RepID=A0A8J2P6Y3_9HEXA|nr:unnamed protein product [Allacma fusca]